MKTRTPLITTDGAASTHSSTALATAAGEAGGGAPAAAIAPGALRRTLRFSIIDAAWWSVMVGAGERYVLPFLVLSGFGVFGIAAAYALPMLASAGVQWFAANFTDAVGRRKPVFVSFSVCQALVWLLIACAIPFLPLRAEYPIILFCFAAHFALGGAGAPAWNSTMGDLVPPDIRGRYFGLRNFLSGSVLVISSLLAGVWISYAEESPRLALFGQSPRRFAFMALFGTACLARMLSAIYLWRMQEPPYHRRPTDHFSLGQFLRRAPAADFGRFVFYAALLHLGNGFVLPFLPWYFLGQLGFSPAQYCWLVAVQLGGLYCCSPFVGRVADRIGNKRMISIGGLGLIAVPVLLLCSARYEWLIAVQICDGALWAAFNIASANYLFDVVTPGKRARCTAVYNAFIVSGAAGGAFLAAGVVALAPAALGPLAGPFTLMLVGALAVRVMANALLLRGFREWRLNGPPVFGSGERRRVDSE